MLEQLGQAINGAVEPKEPYYENSNQERPESDGGHSYRRKKPKRQDVAAKGQRQVTCRQLANKFAGESVDTIVQIMRRSKSDSTKLAAANSILDRAFGKAAQAVEISGEVNVQHQHLEAIRGMIHEATRPVIDVEDENEREALPSVPARDASAD